MSNSVDLFSSLLWLKATSNVSLNAMSNYLSCTRLEGVSIETFFWKSSMAGAPSFKLPRPEVKSKKNNVVNIN